MLKEKFYSTDSNRISVGIANIHPETKNLKANQAAILKALDLFTQKSVNIAIFPEYCLTGCFWEDIADCNAYFKINAIDQLTDWLDRVVESYITDTLQYIIFNGPVKTTDNTYFNTSFVMDRSGNYLDINKTYKKTFLPGLEKQYMASGKNDSLILTTPWGKFGVLTCYDICFPQLVQELVYIQKVDALIVNAAWRKQGKRDYPGLGIKEDRYYQFLWDRLLPAVAFQNQVWVMAANAVGTHSFKGLDYCGGSGIWAPSGITLISGSHSSEELLILHNIDMVHEVEQERKDFNYLDDFSRVYQEIAGMNTSTRGHKEN